MARCQSDKRKPVCACCSAHYLRDMARVTEAQLARTIEAVGGVAAAQDARRLLYHGTGEHFDEPAADGSFDRLFWTAPRADIAQTYIPAALQRSVGFNFFTVRERVRPALHKDDDSFLFDLACQVYGRPVDADPHYDNLGRLQSWRLPADFPTGRDVAGMLRGLGYDFDLDRGGFAFVRVSMNAQGKETLEPANYRMPGRLFVVLPPPDLIVADLRQGDEGDLLAPDHLRLDDFARAASAGAEAVLINDFCQTKSWGNVGHIAYGLTRAGLARCEWTAIPARNFDPGEAQNWSPTGVTPELQDQLDRFAPAEPAPAL